MAYQIRLSLSLPYGPSFIHSLIGEIVFQLTLSTEAPAALVMVWMFSEVMSRPASDKIKAAYETIASDIVVYVLYIQDTLLQMNFVQVDHVDNCNPIQKNLFGRGRNQT